jgi:hypothetical protein
VKRKRFIQTSVRLVVIGLGVFAAASILRRQDRLHLVAGTVLLLVIWWAVH